VVGGDRWIGVVDDECGAVDDVAVGELVEATGMVEVADLIVVVDVAVEGGHRAWQTYENGTGGHSETGDSATAIVAARR